MIGRHRDGEHKPLEQPQVSEEEGNVVADGTSNTDKGGDFFSQTEVGMDHEASQVAARHFELAMFRQQQETIAKTTDWGGYYSIQADLAGNPNTATTARVAAREEATIGRHQRGTASTDQNKQFDPGGKRVNCSFLPSGDVVFCIFCCEFFCFASLQFPLTYQVLKTTRIIR